MAAIAGAGVVHADVGGRPGSGTLPIQPQSPGLAERIWWGSGSRETAKWVGEQGLNMMSSTLLLEDTQVPFDELQAEQIAIFRDAWRDGRSRREPRVSVSRSVIPITTDLDRRLFGRDGNEDQVGWLDGAISRFGRTYTGEPDRIAEELAQDAAVAAADTVLLTVPNQLGVEYNAGLLGTIVEHVAPAIGWGAYGVGVRSRLSAAIRSAVKSPSANSSIALDPLLVLRAVERALDPRPTLLGRQGREEQAPHLIELRACAVPVSPAQADSPPAGTLAHRTFAPPEQVLGPVPER